MDASWVRHIRNANEITIYLCRQGIPHFASTWEHLAMRAKAYIASGELNRFYGRLQRDPHMSKGATQ